MAKLKPAKCFYCEETIDRNLGFGFQKLKNGRYAHENCIAFNKDKKEKQLNDIDKIHKMMKEKCGDSYVKTRVDKQIRELKAQGKTVSGILKTLTYWYDIKGNDAQKANGGIGIVEYVYKEAQEYFEKKERLQKQANELSEDFIQSIIDAQDLDSGPTNKKERIVKPRKTVYFVLE